MQNHPYYLIPQMMTPYPDRTYRFVSYSLSSGQEVIVGQDKNSYRISVL